LPESPARAPFLFARDGVEIDVIAQRWNPGIMPAAQFNFSTRESKEKWRAMHSERPAIFIFDL